MAEQLGKKIFSGQGKKVLCSRCRRWKDDAKKIDRHKYCLRCYDDELAERKLIAELKGK